MLLSWLGAKALAAAAFQLGWLDWSILVLIGFGFFLRTMELLALQFHDIRLSPTRYSCHCNHQCENILCVAAVLSIHKPALLTILQYFWTKARQERRIYTSCVESFRSTFAFLVRSIGLDPVDYLPYIAFDEEVPHSMSNKPTLWVGPWSRVDGKSSRLADCSHLRGWCPGYAHSVDFARPNREEDCIASSDAIISTWSSRTR